jgi:hypothetical protein
MRMQSRNAQQIGFRVGSVEAGERLLNSVVDHGDALLGDTVKAQQIRARRIRYGDQPMRPVRRCPQQESPERQIEPPKIFGMAFVLQVVENGHLPARQENRRGESRVK